MGLRLFERRRVRSAGDRKRLGRFLLHDFTGGRHRGNQQSRYPDATRRIYPGYGKLAAGNFERHRHRRFVRRNVRLRPAVATGGRLSGRFFLRKSGYRRRKRRLLQGNQTIYRRGAQDHDRAGFAVAGQLGLFAELFRMVQAILYRLRPDRPHRIGLPVGLFRIDRKTAYRHAPRFRESGHQTLPERFGDENQRRESRIPRNGNRHDRGPDMAYDPARRRGGGTGEHHRFARRLPDRI